MKNKFVVGFLCYNGSFTVIARSKIYESYKTADDLRKALQPEYKHNLEVRTI